MKKIAIIGGGAAGLMAADILRTYPVQVTIYEAKPSVGRKFLLAGKGGMNITHSENFDSFINRYGAEQQFLQPILEQFNNQAVRDWMQGLGFDSFVGSSGRVFPSDMKAAPLLRAWLHRLRESGVKICVRHRWLGWTANNNLHFSTPEGEQEIIADAVILACGGASWPQLGSDGAWQSVLQEQGITVNPLQAANCGFDSQWSSNFSQEFAGQPLKSAALAFTDAQGNNYRKQGDFVITATGIEGSLIYALSRPLRETIKQQGQVTVYVDLFPHKTTEQLYALLNKPKAASVSWSSFVRKQLGIQGVKASLLRECTSKQQMQDPQQLATLLKALPINLTQTRPITEAISSAGGVAWSALTADLQLKNRPTVFCAGEMIDWEAPTGGYLLTACFATAKCAALGVVRELGLLTTKTYLPTH